MRKQISSYFLVDKCSFTVHKILVTEDEGPVDVATELEPVKKHCPEHQIWAIHSFYDTRLAKQLILYQEHRKLITPEGVVIGRLPTYPDQTASPSRANKNQLRRARTSITSRP